MRRRGEVRERVISRARQGLVAKNRGRTSEGENEAFAGHKGGMGAAGRSLGLSLLSFRGSAVQEERRLKWRSCF